MHINPSSSVSGHHQRSDQARPAESPNDARPEASTTSGTSTAFPSTGSAHLQRSLLEQVKCAPSDSHEAAPAEDIAASSQSGAGKRKHATSFKQASKKFSEMQRLIVEEAAVVPSLPEESAQKLARLATVSKAFRESVQDIQNRKEYLDIKRAGTRGRQEAVMRRIREIIDRASVDGFLPMENRVQVKEEFKTLLAGEPHVAVSFSIQAELIGQHLLLKILSKKQDMESFHLTVSMEGGHYGLEYSLSKLEKINANNPKLDDVTLVIDGRGRVELYDYEVQALVAVLKGNRALQSLSLESLNLNAAIAGALADALKENHLRSLDLRNVRLDAAGMQALAEGLNKNRSLYSLNLSFFSINAAIAGALADALKENHLHSLDLSFVSLDAAGVPALADGLKGNRSLHSLNLRSVPLDAAVVQALAGALKENPSLQSLDLSGATLDAAGVPALADALKENRSLQSLDLRSVRLDAAGVKALADALKENRSLQSLNLSRVRLDAADVKALADALKENRSLHSLNLSATKLSDDALPALAEALKKNKTLKSLDLSDNPKGSEEERRGLFPGVQALADALKENCGLLSLDLTMTSLSDNGAQALAEALKENTTLEVLNVSGNRIIEKKQALISALKENKTLHSLVLRNTFYYEAADKQKLIDAVSKDKDLAARIRL